MSFLLWKLLHIVSVIIFLGNITTGLFWAAHAHKTRDFGLIDSTFKGIIRSDRWFTVPGVVGIVVSGIAAAIDAKFPILATGWILWPIILFSISGIVFGIWVAPLQHNVVNFISTVEFSEQTWEAYEKIYKKWELWGLVSLILSVVAVVIMVVKPTLPGL